VIVAPGTYPELLSSVRGGLQGSPITVRASGGRGSAVVTRVGQVVQLSHPWMVLDGLAIDGQYGPTDTVRVSSGADHLALRNVEVRRSGRDCIDMDAPDDVLIEGSLINRCLWWDGTARQDAHGIVAGPARRLTIRDTEVHTFSGDGLQLDPGRSLPGWDDVLVERSTFWLAPLATPQNGFAAGAVPGENAIDTKTNPAAPRGRLVVRDTVARGFRGGFINNMSAFNLKEQIDATLDRVTVSESEIAFRTRGPGANGGAWVRLRNVVIHDVTTGIRYEDDIALLEAWHVTFGLGVGRVFQAASSGWSGLDVRNSLVLGTTLPNEAPSANRNRAVPSTTFVNASASDYRLVGGSLPVDLGLVLDGVDTDRDGQARVQGAAPDLGAYESRPTSPPPPAEPGPVLTGVRSPSEPTNAVRLTWTDVPDDAGYEVERSADGVTFARVNSLATDKVSWTNSKLVSGRTYAFRVRARTTATPGPYSNVVSAALPAETGVPSAPTGLSLALSSTSPTSSVVVRWQDPSMEEDGFHVEYSADGVTFTRVDTLDVNRNSKTHGGLSSGRLYWYRVRAFNATGPSAWTLVMSIRTQ
jgi:hypothetical protein